VRTGARELVGNRTYKNDVQVDVDISTAGNGVSGLNTIVSQTVLIITTG